MGRQVTGLAECWVSPAASVRRSAPRPLRFRWGGSEVSADANPAVLARNLIGLGLVVQGVDVALLEYALGDEDSVQYAWEPAVGDAVKDRLDDLAGGQADVQRSVDMDLQLRLGTAQRRER